MIDERTELLINRRLDGELSEAEALELNKRLIRSPESRALLEEYERNDKLAGETLMSWTRISTFGLTLAGAAHDAPGRRGWAARLGIGVRSAAAALALITMAGVPSLWKVNRPSQPPPVHPMIAGALPNPATGVPFAPPVIDGPREETHQLHRNVVGVWDEETQSIYLLEMDHHAERVVPLAQNF